MLATSSLGWCPVSHAQAARGLPGTELAHLRPGPSDGWVEAAVRQCLDRTGQGGLVLAQCAKQRRVRGNGACGMPRRVTRRVMAAKAEARRGPARRRPRAGRRQERQSLGARLGVPGSTDPLPGDIRRRRSRPPPARGPSPALAQQSVMALGPIPCPYGRTVAMWSADPGMPPAAGSAAPTGRPMAGRSLSARRTAQSPPGRFLAGRHAAAIHPVSGGHAMVRGPLRVCCRCGGPGLSGGWARQETSRQSLFS